ERADRRPVGEVGQVRADVPAGARAPDRVTACAGALEKGLPARARLRARWLRRRLRLPREPAPALVRWVCVDPEPHVRVLEAAELGALPAVAADLVRVELDRVRAARERVDL